MKSTFYRNKSYHAKLLDTFISMISISLNPVMYFIENQIDSLTLIVMRVYFEIVLIDSIFDLFTRRKYYYVEKDSCSFSTLTLSVQRCVKCHFRHMSM